MAELSLRDVSKVYDSGAVALSPLSLTVKNGDFLVLVGPSGCGKSTLLRLIAGLEKTSTGSMLLDGAPLDAKLPGDRDVAMVFQNYALYPHLTVTENIAFPLRMRGLPANERNNRVRTVAEMLQLTELLHRRPPQLSGGQQQRVALGRAIVRDPKLFLLDEPFSNLDATLRSKTRTELLRLHNDIGATTLFVTHDQVEAMTMADVLVVLNEGKVQQVGAPMDVYRRPANTFVAQFIGAPPMNLLPVVRGKRSGMKLCGYELLHLSPPLPGSDELIAGVRPEHIQVLSFVHASRNNILPAKVMFLEPLGNEVLATCVCGGQDITVRLPPSQPVRPGQDVRLAINFDEAVWFDRTSGNALTPEAVLT